uniref:Uncharacterized protein n=1 Tax=Fagus sylvatica TaxID=28930 RepID=A0A2N9IG62_FAGSY
MRSWPVVARSRPHDPSSSFRIEPPPSPPVYFFLLCCSSSHPSAVSRSLFAGSFVAYHMWTSPEPIFSLFVAHRRPEVAHFSCSFPLS